MNHRIYILTGPIQTGKTTALMNWCLAKTTVAGILTPIVNEKRKFFNISNKEIFDMEADDKEKNILSIGKYNFSQVAFSKAEQIILEPLLSNIQYLVIDEIGPLEIKGEGFYNATKELLQNDLSVNIILVVRKNLLLDIIKLFDLEKNNLHIVEKSFFTSK